MGYSESLQGLVSVLKLSDGKILSVEELSKEEWKQYQHQMLENLKKQMEYYYMQHPKE